MAPNMVSEILPSWSPALRTANTLHELAADATQGSQAWAPPDGENHAKDGSDELYTSALRRIGLI